MPGAGATRRPPRTAATGSATAEVEGVRLSHPEKVLWPGEGITKLDLAKYYAWIAPVLLRYAAQRPLTLRPFPRGVQQPGFYLKDAPRGAPAWLKTFRDVAESTGEPIDFVLADDARTLVWLAQYNAVEVHPWLSRTDRPDLPDWAVVDLDPGEDTPWAWVVQAARAVHQRLEHLGLQSWAKLSGSSGLHVLVPLERVHPFDDVRAFFEAFARALLKDHADILTTDYDTVDRGRRVLFDYAQNARGKTTVCAYSVRPKAGAPVAAPIRWDELDDPGLSPRRWSLRTMRERLDQVGDLLEPALAVKQRLPDRA